MNIREAKISDIDNLVLLNGEIQLLHREISPGTFRETDNNEISQWLLSQVEDAKTRLYVAELNDRIVGYITIKLTTKSENPFMYERRFAHIDHICVCSKLRQSGVGRQMIEYAIAYARYSGVNSLELDVWSDNLNAKKAFQSLGFVSNREQMRLQLNP